MDKELETKLAEFGLPLMLEEISKRYDLVKHIRTYDYYGTSQGFFSELNYFLMKNIQSKKRDLAVEFSSSCKSNGYGHSFGRDGGRSWYPKYESEEACRAIFLIEEWNSEFTLPMLPDPSFIEGGIEVFHEKVLNFTEGKLTRNNAREIKLLERQYWGKEYSFKKELADLTDKYREMMAKGENVGMLCWSNKKPLVVRI